MTIRGSRKLTVYLIGVGLSFAALFYGKLDGVAFQNILIWLTGIYTGGNIANFWRYSKGVKDGGT